MPRGRDLDKLLAGLRDAGPRIMGAAAEALQASVQRSVDRGFAAHQDVDGKRYPAPKDKPAHAAMDKTGELRRSYSIRWDEGILLWRLTLSNSAPHAEYLRDGTATMKPRKHMPRPGDQMPARWDRDAQRSIDSAVRKEGKALWPR